MSTEVILTKEGLQKLEQELSTLKAEKRPEIAEKIKEAREFGDLSENSEYEAALDAQAKMEQRISYLEEQLKNAKVLDESEIDKDTVSVGSKVRILDLDMEDEEEYTIVGKTESDPAENKISDQSPLGQALIGKKKGATVTVDAPGGSYECKILDVSRG